VVCDGEGDGAGGGGGAPAGESPGGVWLVVDDGESGLEEVGVSFGEEGDDVGEEVGEEVGDDESVAVLSIGST